MFLVFANDGHDSAMYEFDTELEAKVYLSGSKWGDLRVFEATELERKDFKLTNQEKLQLEIDAIQKEADAKIKKLRDQLDIERLSKNVFVNGNAIAFASNVNEAKRYITTHLRANKLAAKAVSTEIKIKNGGYYYFLK